MQISADGWAIRHMRQSDPNHSTGQGAPNRSWGGRFKSAPSSLASDFTASQRFDRRLYAQDIRSSKAHARMLGRQGIITPEDAAIIIDGLEAVQKEIDAGKFVWKQELEDVHMNIEARLTEIVGDVGKKLHTGRSRNDQVGLTFRLFVADSVDDWIHKCLALCRALRDAAEKNRGTILPGFTHLQPAQPISLAHYLLAYANMFRRDVERMRDALERIRISPLGAAALAGSTYPLDPRGVADEVGFGKIYQNSLDAVSDRDFVLESLFAASAIMMHISRMCEEIVIWSNPAFGFIRLPDEFSTGSSIMPQKKNPDVAELGRGRCGRVYGHLMAMLTVMKGLPLAYNSDLQEDKESFFDASATVSSTLEVMAAMLSAIHFNAERMESACKSGFLNATELADYLVSKGMPFREAHHVTGRAVALAEKTGRRLEDLEPDEFQELDPRIDNEVYNVLDYHVCVRRRETPGGTGPQSVERQLKNLNEWLAEFE